jgi:hypothetical protein
LLPGSVRIRAYLTGALLANLLDRIDGDWKVKLDAKKGIFLDVLAKRALPGDVIPCSYEPEIVAREKARAEKAVEDYREAKRSLVGEFLKRPGFRIVVDCPTRPLWPAGFDPMNMEKVGPAEVLHRRWLKLSGAGAEVEVLGTGALTEGLDGQPLFHGVRRITITGLAGRPEIVRDGEKIRIKTDTVSLAVEAGELETGDDACLIRLE